MSDQSARIVTLACLLLISSIGCKDRDEKVAVAPADKPAEVPSPPPIEGKGDPKVEENPLKITLEKIIDKPFTLDPGAAKPMAPALPSPLDRLDRNELTPIQLADFPAEAVAVIPGKKGATTMDIAFTPDGKRVALAKSDGVIELWDLTGSKPQQQGMVQLDDGTTRASKVAISLNGAWMASIHGLPGKTLTLWRMSPDGDLRFAASHQLPRMENVAFHPDSKLLVFGSHTSHVAEITDKGLQLLPGKLTGPHACLTFTPDGAAFWCTVFNQARNGSLYGSEIKKWTIAGNEFQENLLLQHDKQIKAMALSPDGKQLAAADLDLKIKLWDLTAKPPTARVAFSMPNWLKLLHYTPDGAYLIAVGNANEIVMWNRTRDAVDRTVRFIPQGKSTNVTFSASAFAPDSRHLAVATYTPATVILRLQLP